MTFEESLRKFKESFPDKKIVGYWFDNGEYIFQVKWSPHEVAPAQFVVDEKGQVHGTNPMRRSVIDPNTMRRI